VTTAPAALLGSRKVFQTPAPKVDNLRGFMFDAASQTIDGDKDRGPFKHLDQPVEQAFVVVMSWLKIFFKNVLGFTDGLNRQFLIAHLLGAPCN
jgi:hypothetical protein